MYTKIMLGVSLGAFVNAFLYASINPVHAITWGVVGGLGLFSIRNRSSKAPESVGTFLNVIRRGK